MKTKELIRCLCRSPLYYKIIRQKGSHRTLKSACYPTLTIGYHDSVEVSGRYIKNLLVNEIGLSEDMARQVIS
jgi:predicted RNA binding protein YcfA (HicA-like mRNA interferase family)